MEYYRLREVILGLRNEYKKNEERLEALKKYIIVNDDVTLDEFDFYSFANDKNKYIELIIRAKQSFIVSLLERLQNKLIKKDNMRQIPISRGYNEDYNYLVLPEEVIYRIDQDKECDLYSEADKLLRNEFITNVTGRKIYVPEADLNLSISPSGIIARTEHHETSYPPAGFIYSAKGDRMLITAYEDYLYNEHINNIFNIRIPSDNFNKTTREIIESNPNIYKELVLEGAEATKNSQMFKMEDINSTTVGLKRTKNKR